MRTNGPPPTEKRSPSFPSLPLGLPAFAALTCLLTLSLPGCAPSALKQDVKGFSRAYGESLNHQLLLNLARLDNGHPPYFLAIGEIRSEYELSAGASGSIDARRADIDETETESRPNALGLFGSTLRTFTTTVDELLTGGADVSAGRVAEPRFQYIPLNSEEVAAQLLEPIAADVFYTLFQQGVPLDQLFRILVARLEYKLDDNDDWEVLSNDPRSGNYDSYAFFLLTAEVLRQLQREGAIVVDTREIFVPLADAVYDKPTSAQLIEAKQEDLEWQSSGDDEWQLGRIQVVPTISVNWNRARETADMLRQQPALSDGRIISNIFEVLRGGLTPRTRPDRGNDARSRLVLRSFSRVIESVAIEQRYFDALRQDPAFISVVPENQQRPVLRTVWTHEEGKLEPPLVSLRYSGKNYQITDPFTEKGQVPETWNRDTFRLIAQLSAQVTVDISRFRIQSLELE